MTLLKILSFLLVFSLGTPTQSNFLDLDNSEKIELVDSKMSFGIWAPKSKTCPNGGVVVRCDTCPFNDRASRTHLCTCSAGDQDLCSIFT